MPTEVANANEHAVVRDRPRRSLAGKRAFTDAALVYDEDVMRDVTREPKVKQKRKRRRFCELDRCFRCAAVGCTKTYSTRAALNLHQRLKHNGLVLPPKSADADAFIHPAVTIAGDRGCVGAPRTSVAAFVGTRATTLAPVQAPPLVVPTRLAPIRGATTAAGNAADFWYSGAADDSSGSADVVAVAAVPSDAAPRLPSFSTMFAPLASGTANVSALPSLPTMLRIDEQRRMMAAAAAAAVAPTTVAPPAPYCTSSSMSHANVAEDGALLSSESTQATSDEDEVAESLLAILGA